MDEKQFREWQSNDPDIVAVVPVQKQNSSVYWLLLPDYWKKLFLSICYFRPSCR